MEAEAEQNNPGTSTEREEEVANQIRIQDNLDAEETIVLQKIREANNL